MFIYKGSSLVKQRKKKSEIKKRTLNITLLFLLLINLIYPLLSNSKYIA